MTARRYAYNNAGDLNSITYTGGSVSTPSTTYTYDRRGRRTTAVRNNITTTVTYKLNRLQSISSTPAGTSAPSLPVGFQYQYNLANQRIRRTDSDSTYWVYQYDALGQVASGRKFWADGTPVDGQQFDYVFDDIGNRDVTGGRASAVSDYTANWLNQYSSRTVPNKVDVVGIANPTAGVTVNGNTANRKGEYFHWPLTVANSTAQYPTVTVQSQYGGTPESGAVFVSASTESYTYDTDGNLTQDGRWDYVWEGENRLLKLRSRTGSPAPERRIEFEYDWQGRRIRQTVWNDRDDGQGSEVGDTIFLYDGWNVMGELNANAENAKLRTYVWGLDLSGTMQGAGGVGGLLKVTDHSSPVTHHFVCYDGNGNVAALADGTSGALTARYEYGPFGEAIRTTGPAAPPMAEKNPFRFSTKYTDDQSGFLYYGYRYYNPATGRWFNRDPIGESGFRTLTITPRAGPSDPEYACTENNLVGSTDRLGLLTFREQSCQGCNAGDPFKESRGYWYEGAETDPECFDSWNWSETTAFGSFKHRCGSKGGPFGWWRNLCDSKTQIRIHAVNDTCCLEWSVSCQYSYTGTVYGQSWARVNVLFTFLGEEIENLVDMAPGSGKSGPPYVASRATFRYVQKTVKLRPGKVHDIFGVYALNTATDYPNEIDEQATVSCFAMCASGLK